MRKSSLSFTCYVMIIAFLSLVAFSLPFYSQMVKAQDKELSQSQQGNTVMTNNTASGPVTNFTKLFSQNKEFQNCFGPGRCITTTIEVLHQGPRILALQSEYLDIIWKGVEAAEKQGYKIDGISTYAVSSVVGSGLNVNVLVVMSKT